MTVSLPTPQKTPSVLYAQDKNQIFVTIDLQDVQEHSLSTTAERISFSTVKDQTRFEFGFELYDKVDEKTWTIAKNNRHIALVAQKQEKGKSFWPRLNKTGKLGYIKTDFSKWKDEEDDEEDQDQSDPAMQSAGMSDQLMQMMAGGNMSPDMMGMMGGAGAGSAAAGGNTNVNIEEIDSDDEEMPALAE